jgi:sRNA-binding protein
MPPAVKAAPERPARAVDSAYRWMVEAFPLSIGRYAPLAIGSGPEIIQTAIEAGHSRNSAQRAIRRHTTRRLYLSNLADPGSMRVNLAGEPIEPVSDEHRNAAREQLGPSGTKVADERRRALCDLAAIDRDLL